MVTFDSTYLKYHFYELKEWKWYLDGFITGILCPTQFYIHIFNNFWFFWIYITKTQVLVTCSILCCILGSYLVFNSGFYSQGETWGHTNFFYHPKSLGVSRGVKIWKRNFAEMPLSWDMKHLSKKHKKLRYHQKCLAWPVYQNI